MKIKNTKLLFLMLLPFFVQADYAPDSGDGVAVHNFIESGSGYLASRGESYLMTMPGSNEYALLGGDENVSDSFGTYFWSKTGSNTASVSFYDTNEGVVLTYQLEFLSKDEGTFSVTSIIGSQRGYFVFRYMVKPTEISTVIAGGAPVIETKNGNAEISFSVKKSSDLSSWTPATGSFQAIDNRIRVSIPMETGTKFFRVEMTEED
jgi:hypothetical protein